MIVPTVPPILVEFWDVDSVGTERMKEAGMGLDID